MRCCLRFVWIVLCVAVVMNGPIVPVCLAAPTELNPVVKKVSKAEVESLLKTGPHAMIRAFLVEPAYQDKKFLGFRLVQRTPHPLLPMNGPVQIGDIIVSANGVRLETPAQYMAAWGKLKTERSFSIVLLKNGQKIELKWALDGS